MSAILNACCFVPTAGGTTDWTFSSAVQGYNTPSQAGAVNAETYEVRAESADLSQWEISRGSYNSATGVFARTTVLYNSSGTGTATGQTGAGSKINFSAAPRVTVTATSFELPSLTAANNIFLPSSATKTDGVFSIIRDPVSGTVVSDNLTSVVISVDNDNANVPALPFAGFTLLVSNDLGSAGTARGSRYAIRGASLNTTAANATTGDLVGVSGVAQGTFPNGGTDTGAGALGSLYGIEAMGIAGNGATNFAVVCGGEVGGRINTGGSARYRWGLSFVSYGNVRGASEDQAVHIAAQSTTNWGMGIGFSNANGQNPISTTGTLIGTDGSSVTVANFAKFDTYTFTGDIFYFPNFRVTGAGSATVSQMVISATNANYVMISPSGATDQKNWDYLISGATMQFRAVNDAFSVGNPWLTATRSGATVTDISTPASFLCSFAGGAVGGIGYAAGAGGTVTQLTSKATGVTLDKVTGTIVTAADALAAGAMVSFQLSNACVDNSDAVVLNHRSGGTAGAYTLNGRCLAGAITIEITNRTGGSLSEAITIKFLLLKAKNA